MRKIVLTGGCCGGKSTVLAVLQQQFAGQVLVVPEAPTCFSRADFHCPGATFSGRPSGRSRSKPQSPGCSNSLNAYMSCKHMSVECAHPRL